MQLPKKIFYVWGHNEILKESAKMCIATWKKYLPDYEIIQINEQSIDYFNFQKELNTNKWFQTVYNRKMWAYVADYVRIKTLYDNGGIYLDTDVEVCKSFNDIINNSAFVGIQDSSIDGNNDFVEPAILGACKHNLFLKKILGFYNNLIWTEPIYTMPEIFKFFLKDYNVMPFPAKKNQKIIYLNDIVIYPEEYFIPYRSVQKFTERCLTPNTHTIHKWGGSWYKPETIFFLKNKHLYSLDELNLKILKNEAEFLRQEKLFKAIKKMKNNK